ncbi:MAG: glycosyltransferase family 9 protein [Chloroherpetonaceae bacterium]|nr:glycosyltransferase family 9 protein [Chloroherpetonaceae bacterium]
MAVGGIGDAILFVPVLEQFRKKFSDRKVVLLTNHHSAGSKIYETQRHLFDELLTFSVLPENWKVAFKLNLKLIQFSFEEVFITYLSSQSIFFILPGLVTGRKQTVGLVKEYGWTWFYSFLFTNHYLLERASEKRSEFEFNKLLLGEDVLLEMNWQLMIPESYKIKAKTWMNENSVRSGSFLTVHAGSFSSQDYKRYPLERLAKVLDNLSENFETIVLLGTPSEEDIYQPLTMMSKASLIGCFNQDLYTVASIIEHSSLFLGNDSGLGHLALLLNRPSVRIFGPSFYYGFKKWKEGPFIDIWQPIECSPCLRLGMLEKEGINAFTCGHRNCLNQIEPESVTIAAKKLIRG